MYCFYCALDSSSTSITVFSISGDVFAPIVEEGMQAEVWMGPIDREEDMRDASMSRHWKVGLIVRIHKKKRSDDSSSGMLTKSSKPAADDQDSKNSIRYLFDFAYLKNENDSDETLEKNVDPIRTRLLVGSGSPVPDSIDEARLSLLGGEEIISFESQQAKPNDAADSDPIGAFQEQIDENTGFTKFATISIRKVTTAHEERQERQRAKKERNDVIQRQLELQNEVRKRQMEEAKHTNGDDSALGAYDVWTDGKNGYKGIDINREGAEEDTENAKSLAEGKGNVLFKKKKAMDLQDNVGDIRAKFRKVRKKNFRHKTSTTHDDD